MSTGGRRLIASAVAAFVGVLAAAPAAQASFHLMKIREVYPAGDASYVELQMYSAGEYLVAGHHLVVYNSDGSVANDFTLPSNVSIGSPNNSTVLIADSGYAAAFPGKPSPDEMDNSLNLSATGGAVCWTDGSPPDCVAWGNFTGPLPSHVPALVVGNPASPGGVTSGKALQRSIAPGCSTLLEAGDDSDNSATDFFEATPNPRNNASPVIETTCAPPTAPDTSITSATPSASRTNSTDISFTFTATPSTGATFECKLDAEPSFTACTSPKSYSNLAGGTGTAHTFQVRAVHPTNGTDLTPATYSWTVDTVAPAISILNHPADPSPGATASFTYQADEQVVSSSFQCSLAAGAASDSFASCPSTGMAYSNLTDGITYTFKVRAADPAGNQSSPPPGSSLSMGTYQWTIDNSVADTVPPETTIDTKPSDPSSSSTASFTYHSNEANSTFQCKLDGAAFASCGSSGVTYTGLANGSHTFQVKATDPSNNTDASPAGYTFSVVLPSVTPPPTQTPPPLLPPVPQTTIGLKPPAKTHDRTPTFKFGSPTPGSSFQCKIDGGGFKPCRSPFTTKALAFGRHTLKIRAILAGVPDPTPATFNFKVVKR